MTKKRVSLLFLLMLCNAAPMRAEWFGFLTAGLFGWFKGAGTIFSSRQNYEFVDNISETIGMEQLQKKASKGWFRGLWKKLTSRWGFITSGHVEKLGKRINGIENKFNTMAQESNDKLNQVENVSGNLQIEVTKARELVEQFRMNYLRNNINIEIKQNAIKKEINQSAKNFEETINRGYDEINQKIIANGTNVNKKIDQINKQKQELIDQTNNLVGKCGKIEGSVEQASNKQIAADKQTKEALKATEVQVNELSESVQKLGAHLYETKKSYEQRDKKLFLNLQSLSIDEFKRFKKLNLEDPHACNGFSELTWMQDPVIETGMSTLKYSKKDISREMSTNKHMPRPEAILMAYAVHILSNQYKMKLDDLD